MKQQTSQKPISMAWLAMGLSIMLFGAEALFYFRSLLRQQIPSQNEILTFKVIIPYLLGALLICFKSFHFSLRKTLTISFVLTALLWGKFFLFPSVPMLARISSSIFSCIIWLALLSSFYPNKKNKRFLIFSSWVLLGLEIITWVEWFLISKSSYFYVYLRIISPVFGFLIYTFYVSKLQKWLDTGSKTLSFGFVARTFLYAIGITYLPLWLLIYVMMTKPEGAGAAGMGLGGSFIITVPIGIFFFIVRLFWKEHTLLKRQK